MSLEPTSLAFHRIGSNFLTIHLQNFVAKIITVYIFIFVFEETIYGRLSLGASSYLIAKTVTEGFLYFVLLIVIAHRLYHGSLKHYQLTFFDYCIILFLCLALISTVVNEGSLIQGAINVRTMLRYIVVYYIIVLSRWIPTEKQFNRIFKLLIYLAIFQALLTGFQHLLGDDFRNQYFSPLVLSENTTNGIELLKEGKETKLGAGYGTFGKPAALSFYLLLVSAILLVILHDTHSSKKYLLWIGYIILLIGIYFSYKRGPLILALALPIFTAWFMGYKSIAWRYIVVGLLLTPILFILLSAFAPKEFTDAKNERLSPTEAIAQLFTDEYWENTNTSSRGWFIQEVGIEALSSSKLIGYGADPENAQKILAQQNNNFAKLIGWKAFEDVYIVAMTIYYGQIGTLLIILSYCYLFKIALINLNKTIGYLRKIKVILLVSILLLAGGIFLERVLELRAFTFIFWVFAGLVTVINRYAPPSERLSVLQK